MTAVRRAGAIALLALAFAVSGCGETIIDSAKTEDAIEQDLERATGKKVATVECPSNVEVTKDATFACTVSFAGGERETATLRILNEDADVALTNLQPTE
ncbi:MAG TPA: DUF4333 domain-containing protein [Solirubrobacterales bacterium]|nr:DUF4333 domain-containing protein [Solirubrobacterales bacterium]